MGSVLLVSLVSLVNQKVVVGDVVVMTTLSLLDQPAILLMEYVIVLNHMWVTIVSCARMVTMAMLRNKTVKVNKLNACDQLILFFRSCLLNFRRCLFGCL